MLTTARRWREQSMIVHLRLAIAASPALGNAATALTTLLLVPLCEVVLLAIMSVGLTGSLNVRTAYAVILIAFGAAVINEVVGAITRDRNIGVLSAVLQHGAWQPRYWFARVVLPLTSGIGTIALSAVTVWWFDPDRNGSLLTATLLLALVTSVSGAIVGVACALLTIGSNDPYLIVNLLNWGLMIATGAVLPITEYPVALEWLGRCLPFTALIESLRTGEILRGMLGEAAVMIGWSIVAAIVSRFVLRRWRSGTVREELW